MAKKRKAAPAGAWPARKPTSRGHKRSTGISPRQTHPVAPISDGEIFIGLVGPTGTDLENLIRKLKEHLAGLKYSTEVISLSALISQSSASDVPMDEYAKIKFLMAEGTNLCIVANDGDFVARLGVAGIRNRRQQKTGDANRPAPRTAYIVRSFKRKEEITLFRRIYGKAFNLVSAFSSAESRRKSLSKKLSKTAQKSPESMEPLALELMHTDYAEEAKCFGQSVRDTFPLADYFVAVDSIDLTAQVKRLVELIFGNPYLTPTRNEQAMFLAKAAALRSGDLSRQVGAVVVSQDGELLATGCNEVPTAGGGLYWAEDASPARDIEFGFDMNARIKSDIVRDLLHKLRSGKWLKKGIADLTDEEIYQRAVVRPNAVLRDAQCLDVIEFGRAVHAEMASLSDAAKRGVSTKGARLFCTTFPCHICARHIVAAGIAEVFYIEPYPKSRTAELFPDSIETEKRGGNRVQFIPFVGVAPRRYFDWFELVDRRKDHTGNALEWPPENKSPRFERFVLSYLLMEAPVVASLAAFVGEKNG